MKTLLYRAAAGLVGFGCVIGVIMLIFNWKGWSGSVVFAMVNLSVGAWFLLDYALRSSASQPASAPNATIASGVAQVDQASSKSA
jgi:hypothetical protein